MHLLPWWKYSEDQKQGSKCPAFFNSSRYFAKRNLDIITEFTSSSHIVSENGQKLKSGDEIFWEDEDQAGETVQFNRSPRYRRLSRGKHKVESGLVICTPHNIREVKNTPFRSGKVIVLNNPMKVIAGELIGYPGIYNEENMIHFEIFMESLTPFWGNPSNRNVPDPDIKPPTEVNLYD